MGNIQILEILIPRSDKIFNCFGKVNYEDSFCLSFGTRKILDIDFIIFKLINSFPKWFKFLLNLRNVIANIFALKTGKIEPVYNNPDNLNFNQDQWFGDFFIILNEKHHLIAELKDKHLDFRFSILIKQEDANTKLSLSTVVKFNNFFGKIYFFFVSPFHRLIIPNILKRLGNTI